MLQWFIRFPEFAEFSEFLFHLEKTPWSRLNYIFVSILSRGRSRISRGTNLKLVEGGMAANLLFGQKLHENEKLDPGGTSKFVCVVRQC